MMHTTSFSVCVCVCVCVCVLHTQRERERERERDSHPHVHSQNALHVSHIVMQLHLDFFVHCRKKTHFWFKIQRAESVKALRTDTLKFHFSR